MKPDLDMPAAVRAAYRTAQDVTTAQFHQTQVALVLQKGALPYRAEQAERYWSDMWGREFVGALASYGYTVAPVDLVLPVLGDLEAVG